MTNVRLELTLYQLVYKQIWFSQNCTSSHYRLPQVKTLLLFIKRTLLLHLNCLQIQSSVFVSRFIMLILKALDWECIILMSV